MGRPLTEPEKDAILALAEKGYGAKRIGTIIQRHEGAVQWFLYRMGLRAPGYGNSQSHVRSNGRAVKPFSPEEDAALVALRVEGLRIAEIARRITEAFGHPRSPDTVRNRLTMLAAREEAA
ncbi:hypothetical protein MKK75_03200 [Methylobacterium sp. J-030]|uniref:hypothetical protein n=1 Tax=Methylobacterium sp. J-030 TaxID=2836627 RepID=UPI001FB95325|nr:hypothetical protein [Methylobacterium sp. J-030]MCJ2067823.1 hypothetical protein [Methylobacterium sp. J-030]